VQAMQILTDSALEPNLYGRRGKTNPAEPQISGEPAPETAPPSPPRVSISQATLFPTQ